MRRREFIRLVGGAAAASSLRPLAAYAQGTLPVIGCLHSGSPGPAARSLTAFREGLAEIGYAESHNVVIEYRFAEDQLDRLPILAADLVRREVAVIAALSGSDSARAAKGATTSIPIVFNIGNDPVQTGLVASLSRPGANITGVTMLSREVQGKRLAMARELLPNASLLATFTNTTSVVADFNLRDLEAAAAGAGLRLLVLKTGGDRELEAGFVEIVRQGAGALFINGNPFFYNNREVIVALAARYRIPTIFSNRDFVEAGGLMSYGTSLEDSYRLAGTYAGRILKGEKAADLPIQQAAKFDLVINLKAARALGLTMPTTLLALADAVFE